MFKQEILACTKLDFDYLAAFLLESHTRNLTKQVSLGCLYKYQCKLWKCLKELSKSAPDLIALN